MVIQFKDLFIWYNLVKIITCIKDEGINLNTLTTTLTCIVSYVFFLLSQPYVVNCYGHAMSKCCQCVINDLKVCGGIKEVSN
jgi:hypothetical protein